MNGIPAKPSICFGVPSLDDLFGTFGLSHRTYGIPVEDGQTNLTLVGPDGAGKSLLALHVASRYAADTFSRAKKNGRAAPQILYISTDLSQSKAQSTWSAFRLDRPNLREVPFYHGTRESKEPLLVEAEDVALQVRLLPLDLSRDDAEDSLADYILTGGSDGAVTPGGKPEGNGKGRAVGFIDLIRNPVGDLWSFTSRLLASLPGSEAGAGGSADQHLVVIDNVDGFEVLMGEVNAYGDRSSVRARIMEAVRAAAGKAHLVFIAEQEGAGAAPLADISDVVVRLRISEELGYKYRAIEIEKARAQAVHRGDHYLFIRTGGGSTTGTQENPDDPRTANAYLQVIPSLSTLSRRSMNEPNSLKPGPEVNERRRAGFGLEALDELCGCAEREDGGLLHDAAGVRYGTLSAILGDSNTHKTPLAEKFILRGFELFARNLNLLYEDWRDNAGRPGNKTAKLVEAIGRAQEQDTEAGGGSQDGDAGKRLEQLRDGFEQAKEGEQLRFISRLLLDGHGNAEQHPRADDLEKQITDSLAVGRIRPALAFLCGSWAGRILKNRLKDLIEPTGDAITRELVRACLPDAAYNTPYCVRLWESAGIEGDELLEAANQIWWDEFRHAADDANAPALSVQYEWMRRYFEEAGAPRKELAQQVIDHRRAGGKAGSKLPEKEKQELQRKNLQRWKDHYDGGESGALDFIEARFPGSSDYLARETRRRIRREGIATARFSAEELKRMFIGAAIRHIDSYLQREDDLTKWLRRLEIWPEKGQKTVGGLGQALLEVARRTGGSEGIAAEVAGHFRPRVKARSYEVKDVIAECAPHLPDYKSLGESGAAAATFAEWLFDFSPNTHPYAFHCGKKSLGNEIERLLSGKGGDGTPIFCSAMVAAVLQMVRLGKLSLSGHLDDELRARRDASESVKKLWEWVKEYLASSELGDRAEDCKEAIVEFCRWLSEGKLEPKNVVEFVKAVSRRRGLDWEAKDLTGELRPEKRLDVCRVLLECGARAGLCDGPVVLIATNDKRWVTFRDRYMRWLRRFLEDKGYDEATARHFERLAEDHLREWLIIRRLEVHYLSTATLSAIIRRCVVIGQALLFDAPGQRQEALKWMVDINERRNRSWNLRVVIDGLTTVRNTYPNVDSDPLFLPALRFFISSENITGMVVVSQAGRPDNTGEDRFEREVTDLFLNQIRTWRVQFYGELRVAVTTLPPADEGSARIRELLVGPQGDVEIDPHFELYKGLETGKPERVGLEIRLIGDTPVWQAYRNVLNEVFADVFAAADAERRPGQVVLAEPTHAWTEKMRDFARLHRGTHLDHTLILQVDEFWGFQRSDALRNEYRYLTAECHSEERGEGNDPLEMFQATLAGPEAVTTSRRYHRFVWTGYHRSEEREHWTREERASVDRVPFLWDFGFLLCHRAAWDAAAREALHIARKNYCSRDGEPEWKGSVGEIWSSLKKIPGLGGGANGGGPLALRHTEVKERYALSTASWRLFLEAAVVTASHRSFSTTEPSPAFDLAVRSGESLSCLILEIWASEVYRKFERDSNWADELKDAYFARFTQRFWAPALTRGLVGLIAEPETRGSLKGIYGKALAAGRLPDLARHSLDLFKALLLIGEAMNPASFVKADNPVELESRPVSKDAVAARHWYGTACEFLENCREADGFIPVQLPGHFSVRGDWFLAVAKGSHSSLLADRALDLLSSRRGQFDRLRLGLGLPVREVDPNSGLNPRTRLTATFDNGRKEWIRYKDLRSLGAKAAKQAAGDRFYWLWRSSLGDYDAQDRAFQQGMVVLVNWWKNLKSSQGTDWKTGFHLYDAIDEYQAGSKGDAAGRDRQREIFDRYFAVNSLWEFPELCDDLIQSLKRATPRTKKISAAVR